MGTLLLVAVSADEERRLRGLVPSARSVGVDGLDSALGGGAGEEVGALVVGTAAPEPLTVVQGVHRAMPTVEVLVLTTGNTDAEVRRAATYAPGLPASLAVVREDDPELGARVLEALEVSRARRRHRTTLDVVTARRTAGPPQRLAPASLGALLDHAPFGVLVAALDGTLVTWNRWAGDLLELPHGAAGQPVFSLFADPEPLEKVFAAAREGLLVGATEPFGAAGPGETDLELTTATTLLDDGREAVLVFFQDVTATRTAERTRDRLAQHVGLLGRVSETLAGTLDLEQALRHLADELLPEFADWLILQIHDERGQSGRVVVRHREAAHRDDADALRVGVEAGLGPAAPSRRVVADGRPVLLERVGPDEVARFLTAEPARAAAARMGLGSVVSVPLPGRAELFGTLSLVRSDGAPAYTSEELAIGVEVGRRAGLALDTLALLARQRDLAEELQRSLLTEPPRTQDVEIVVRYVAAAQEAQVGGDWYDAFVQADGSTVLVIGDVMGHDMRAAAAMGQLRALLRGIGYTTGTGPAEMLSRLDAAVEGLGVETTATSLVVRVEPRAAGSRGPTRLCWSNAGHPPPILVAPGSGAAVLESDDPDLLLGVLAHAARSETGAVLEPGSTLLLYTDGLIERRGESVDRGVSALAAVVDRLAGLPLPRMCDRLLAELLPDENDDDVALVAVRLRG